MKFGYIAIELPEILVAVQYIRFWGLMLKVMPVRIG